jgi:hypothetical protein
VFAGRFEYDFDGLARFEYDSRGAAAGPDDKCDGRVAFPGPFVGNLVAMTCVRSLRSRLALVLISKLYRQMYANTGIATDSARVARARWIARIARRLFITKPMPDLQEPSPLPTSVGARGRGNERTITVEASIGL